VSDPAHPVPYRQRPVDMTYPSDHPELVHVAGAGQRFVVPAGRADVADQRLQDE